ncbi:MAG: lasso peptide biosynthesis B2 protein [Candidatus Rokubacteria bacterium]|nr:lasso peptide biosynthesis B2 protein [Candidatus Rokubacteria bacterium]
MKSLGERFRKFLRLSRRDRVVLGQAWALFLFVELALRLLRFKHVLALCQRPRKWHNDPALASPASLSRLAWLVEVAGHCAPGNVTCLKKALVLSWLLRKRGVATTLRIGVSREGGSPKAHAWLDHEGQATIGLPASGGYEPLVAMEMGGARPLFSPDP